MPVLTGYSESEAIGRCDPEDIGGLDNCPFIWKNFKANGYVTAYGEDEQALETFNLMKRGFYRPPTHHYFRPFGIAAENLLDTVRKFILTHCVGYQDYVDYISKYLIDFAKIYRNESYFGFFWSNSFSHEDFAEPTKMDLKMKKFFVELETEEILEKSIVIFFSDHGMRFGPLRQLLV